MQITTNKLIIPNHESESQTVNKLLSSPFELPLVLLSSASFTRINSWHAVAVWRWDVPNEEVCGICHVAFDGCCPNCKLPGDDCPLSKSSYVIC